jgi:hypothetical protein
MRRPSVLFPHPLSPMSPTVSPRRTRSETPSTARRSLSLREKKPERTAKYLPRPSVATSVRGRAAAVASPRDPPGGARACVSALTEER